MVMLAGRVRDPRWWGKVGIVWVALEVLQIVVSVYVGDRWWTDQGDA